MKISWYSVGSGLLVGFLVWGAVACSGDKDEAAAPSPSAESAGAAAGSDQPEMPPTPGGRLSDAEMPPMVTKEEAERIVRESLEAHTPTSWGPPGQLDPATVPNPYVHEGLGVSIERPEAWVWLAETSSPDFASLTDPAIRDRVDPSEWADPGRTPLIAMSTAAEPVAGVDPVVRIEVRPLTGAWQIMSSVIEDPIKMVQTELDRGAVDHAAFEVVDEPSEVVISGIGGATATARYEVTGDDGETRVLRETVWYAPRPPYLFFLRARQPADSEASVTQAIEAAAQSLVIENGAAG